MDDNLDIHKVLMEFRNTPSESSNLSPIEVMLNRQTRSVLPVASSKLDSVYQEDAKKALEQSKCKQAVYYNRTAKARPPLNIGDTVRIKDRPSDTDWRAGIITASLPHRSYNVQLSDNSTRRRTSKHIKWSPVPPLIIDEHDTGYSQPPVGASSQVSRSSPPDAVNHSSCSSPSPTQSTSNSSNDAGTIISTQRSSTLPTSTSQQNTSATSRTFHRSIQKTQSTDNTTQKQMDETVKQTRSGRIIKRPQRYSD